jgi:hypothetical protein
MWRRPWVRVAAACRSRPLPRRRSGQRGRAAHRYENASLAMPFYTENGHFTETGSGRTQGKTQKEVHFFLAGGRREGSGGTHLEGKATFFPDNNFTSTKQNRPFCQDRLGTSTRKAWRFQTKDRWSGYLGTVCMYVCVCVCRRLRC